MTRAKTEHDRKILEVLASVTGDGKDNYLKETKITIKYYFPKVKRSLKPGKIT